MQTEELNDILTAVREFIHERVIPREEEIEDTDAIPGDLKEAAKEMGLFGFAIPEEYGGLGLTAHEEVQLAFELSYTAASFRSLFGTNNGIAGQVLLDQGTEEQKNYWLPKIASGEIIASFCLTEPDAGSDPSGMRTSARKDGGDYVIKGAKRFITNAALSSLLIVFARTDQSTVGTTKGISAFLVPTDTPGVTVGPHDKKMGQQGAWTSEVFFDDVRVPASSLVGGAEEVGFRAAMQSLAKGRINIAALCIGQAQRIIDESIAYANSAKQGGNELGTFQLIQAMLADSYTEHLAAKDMVLSVAKRYDSGEDRKLGPSAAKLFASEMLGRVADRGIQIHGGMGYMRSVPVERFYRAARLFRIYEGTSEIQKLIIARQILKTS